ncbi:urea amidolyase family protein (plasmid) [Deinococcus sp. KNUC1210]|uniref:5-oxoprolinase subunit B/C family protein n=1 Tax=Deinococcus sp. KNUC1210 TaxID=2917691 RepID=UPI001EF125F1|nr:urea amidolyase family protein [Deinococcus sp. KNUC1210]ULH14179.1 urea amidolyase family protein [Deinococcus sp. KNUC1210]
MAGFYVQFSEPQSRRQNLRLLALHRALMADLPDGVSDVSPAYVNLYVEFDDQLLSPAAARAWVQEHLEALGTQPGEGTGRTVTIPVRYDGEDLPGVAARTGLKTVEVIRLHSQTEYHVYATGFTPGFPFLGEVPEALRLPRRDTPRRAVPFNAVAIANAQSCVYVLPSPGGWHLLGTALRTIYDPGRESPFLIAAGDTVRFVPQDGPTPPLPAVRDLWPAQPRLPALRIEEPGLLDLLMDGGRVRQAQVGLARSGTLDMRAARTANRLVGNLPRASVLEFTLRGPVLTALHDVVVAVAGFGMRPVGQPMQQSFRLRAGETLRFESVGSGARAYLAVAGGLETLPFLGSSSTDLIGRVGRPLRAGDVLGLGQAGRARPGFSSPLLTLPDALTLRLLPGPQATLEALTALGRAPFRVVGGDRMGLRLSGPAVPGGQVVSEATPEGALQVTPAGEPILLLSDRGRIGGYNKPAVLHPLDLPLAAQVRPGQLVRFRPDLSGSPDEWARRWKMSAD